MSILITGSNGFVGSNLAYYLSTKDLKIITSSEKNMTIRIQTFYNTEFNQYTNWKNS